MTAAWIPWRGCRRRRGGKADWRRGERTGVVGRRTGVVYQGNMSPRIERIKFWAYQTSLGRRRVLVCVETKLIKEDESIDVRFYDGTRVGARVFMQKTAFRHHRSPFQ